MQYFSTVGNVAEWSFTSGKSYADPFNEVVLNVVFAAPDGREMVVPAFWGGGQTWRVRFSGDMPGVYKWRSVCSDVFNPDLHGVGGRLEIAPYEGNNPLLKHGAIRVSENGRHFEHRDGTPFFWLGDTWWMGFCKRLRWPDEFQLLAADRVKKGFTVVQIVAGLYPDMGAFDDRGVNEAGHAWERDWARINPAYYDMADLRIAWLVRSGIVPCIVGCWGYYVHWLGVEKMKKHWRYLIARYGAYPVVWCACGEVLMPYYLEPMTGPDARKKYDAKTREAWNEVTAYLRQVDPYKHPVTAHPCRSARESLDDKVLDFDMLQTGHGDRTSLRSTVDAVTKSYATEPPMPVVEGEVCYEGIGEACRQEVQRMMFWTCMLSGAAGFTYGANGIWQVNGAELPYGPSPHGMSWGDTPWEDAYKLPGSRNLGLARSLLERYEWHRFEPHPEWVEPRWNSENYTLPYAGGIPGVARVIFIPAFTGVSKVLNLERGVEYHAFYWNPRNGEAHGIGRIEVDADGSWKPPRPPIFQDWLLVLGPA
ncbi:MAG TPA: DUF4038 domain-containing protein [Candidatus Brocadiia bacterium]|nr:DUF4038 domain-containing protein [Candidatus Brocadiia bacterium]